MKCNKLKSIFLQPLPHDLQGGPLRYEVEFHSDKKLLWHLDVKDSDKPFAVLSDFSRHARLMVRVWSRNSISRSDNYTELIIPPYSSIGEHFFVMRRRA